MVRLKRQAEGIHMAIVDDDTVYAAYRRPWGTWDLTGPDGWKDTAPNLKLAAERITEHYQDVFLRMKVVDEDATG